jgi:hypothetical protein
MQGERTDLQGKSIEERFWSKVDIKGLNECWPWKGYINPSGYGLFRYYDRYIGAHKIALILSKENIPEDSIACHKCDNRKCCNPNHIYPGTNSDNQRDRYERIKTKRRSMCIEVNLVT